MESGRELGLESVWRIVLRMQLTQAVQCDLSHIFHSRYGEGTEYLCKLTEWNKQMKLILTWVKSFNILCCYSLSTTT